MPEKRTEFFLFDIGLFSKTIDIVYNTVIFIMPLGFTNQTPLFIYTAVMNCGLYF